MRIIISIKFFTIGNFVEITVKPFKRMRVFVMRLLARVTGEGSEAMYVWHRCWRVPGLKKERR